jgi:PilZ domain-containing protein
MNSTPRVPTRSDVRFKRYRDLSVTYEGRQHGVVVREPDVSITGMFINVSGYMPEGAVVKVRFVLNRSGYEVNVRAEVRYCLPDVGIGVRFLDISPEAQQAILEEFSDSPPPASGA